MKNFYETRMNPVASERLGPFISTIPDTGPGFHDYLFSGTLNRPSGMSLGPYLALINFSYLLVALMMRDGNVLWWNNHKMWPLVQ